MTVHADLARSSPGKRKGPVARTLSFELNLIDPKVNLFCSSGGHPTGDSRAVNRVQARHPAICVISLPAAARLRPLRHVVNAAEGVGDAMLSPVPDQEDVRLG